MQLSLKKSIFTGLVMALTLVSIEGFAKDEKKKPCKTIEAACLASGFVKNGHKNGNKGLNEDCFMPILKGQKIEGVTVTDEVIKGCKGRVKKVKELKIEAQENAKEKRLEPSNSK
jgi:hypothetical protein